MEVEVLRSCIIKALDEMKSKALEMGIQGVAFAFSGALSEEDLEVAKYGIGIMKKEIEE